MNSLVSMYLLDVDLDVLLKIVSVQVQDEVMDKVEPGKRIGGLVFGHFVKWVNVYPTRLQ